MAVESTMLGLGTRAPDFRLPEPRTGQMVSRDDFRSAPALLVVFLCNHCPYVKHVQKEMARLIKEYQEKGLAAVGISANDIASHPQDGPEMMAQEAAAAGYTFPYLYDESQEVARAYHAACTPDFFLFNKERALVYRGQMDGSRPGNAVPLTGSDLRNALDALLAGKPVSADQKASRGCGIKWKLGNEPEYPGKDVRDLTPRRSADSASRRSADSAARIWDCVSRADRTTLQNVLMRMPDKVCAIAFATLTEERRRSLYALIAGPKAARISEEIRLEARRRTSALVRGRILRSFLSYFGLARNAGGTIYIRPRRGSPRI